MQAVERGGTIRVPGATELRLVLDDLNLEPLGFDKLYVGRIDDYDGDAGIIWNVQGDFSLYDAPGTEEVTTVSVSGDTIELLMDSDSSTTGSFVIRSVEYKGTATGGVENVGKIFPNSGPDEDCDEVCRPCPPPGCVFVDTTIAEPFDKALEPVEFTLESAAEVASLPDLVVPEGGKVWRISPDGLYNQPVTVQVPLSEPVPLEELEIWYYSENGGQEGWYRGENVLGWLVPDTLRVVNAGDQLYVEFQATHSGAFQIARVPELKSASSAPILVNVSGSAAQWLLMLAALGALAAGLYRVRKARMS